MAIAGSIILVLSPISSARLPLRTWWRGGGGASISENTAAQRRGNNIATIVSKRWGAFVTVVDVLKGAVMVLVARWLGLGAVTEVVVGLAAIAGHKLAHLPAFNGGRGIFTSFGVILALSPVVSRSGLSSPSSSRPSTSYLWACSWG